MTTQFTQVMDALADMQRVATTLLDKVGMLLTKLETVQTELAATRALLDVIAGDGRLEHARRGDR